MEKAFVLALSRKLGQAALRPGKATRSGSKLALVDPTAHRRSTPPLYLPPLSGACPPMRTLAGMVEALSELPEWRGTLALNAFEQRVVFRRAPPLADASAIDRSLGDEDIDRIRLWFETEMAVVVSRRILEAMNELLTGALGLRAHGSNPNVTTRVSRILESLGFERRRKMVGGRRMYFYAKAALPHCLIAPLQSR